MNVLFMLYKQDKNRKADIRIIDICKILEVDVRGPNRLRKDPLSFQKNTYGKKTKEIKNIVK